MEKTTNERLMTVIFTVLLLAGIILQSGYSSADSSAVFKFDQAAFQKAKTWTAPKAEER